MIAAFYKLMIGCFGVMSVVLASTCSFGAPEDQFTKVFNSLSIGYAMGDHKDSVTQNVLLPTESTTGIDVIIEWSSSNPNVLSASGIVARQVNDFGVTLTLKLTIDDASKSKLITVTVLGTHEESNYFTVTFDSAGGSIVAAQQIEENSKAVQPVSPTKNGYVFGGWYLNAGLFNFDTPITQNMTLTARWNEHVLPGDDPLITGRTLLWNDEFNGITLDTSKWSFQNGTGSQFGIEGWGNQEKQYYQPDNLTISNGTLKIEAKKTEHIFNGYDSTMPYTSSKIVTEKKFDVKYGRIEAKIKAPIGEGFWPAFWMLPSNNVYGGWPYSGEIDIMEIKGRLPNKASSAIHFSWNPTEPAHGYHFGEYTMPAGQTINQFHIYAVEWTEGRMEFSVDNNVYHVRSGSEAWPRTPQPFDQKFWIILNLAVGGHFDGHREPNLSDFPAIMEVDYVRVYAPI